MIAQQDVYLMKAQQNVCSHFYILFLFSFGQPCVFLLGGTSKEVPPTPLGLYSGDVLVMAGGARLAYHAVPRVGGEHWEQLGGGDPYGRDGDIEEAELPWEQSKTKLKHEETNETCDSQFSNTAKKLKSEQINQNQETDESPNACDNNLQILSTKIRKYFEKLKEIDVKLIHEYASRYRINMNVRQVCKKDCTLLNYEE